MRVLVDAQLPRRPAYRLRNAGHDAVHTLDLPARNRTTDAEICRRADAEGRIVVTKDADFVASHLLRGEPSRLLLVATGNVSNRDLEALLLPRLGDIDLAFGGASFVEVSQTRLVVHG